MSDNDWWWIIDGWMIGGWLMVRMTDGDDWWWFL